MCFVCTELLGGTSLAKKNQVMFLNLYRTCIFYQPGSLNPGCSRVVSAWAHGWEQNCPFSSGLSDSWAVTWNPEIEKLKPRSAFISENSIKAQFLLHRKVLLDSAFFQILVQWRMTTGFPCCSQWVKKHSLNPSPSFSLDVGDPECMRTADLSVQRAVLSLQCPFPASPANALCACAVPEGDKAVPAPRGPAVPHQHLPGGWHPHVVPVEWTEGLHRRHVELWLLPGLHLCVPKPLRAAEWLYPGAE